MDSLKRVIDNIFSTCISFLILIDTLQRHSDTNKESTKPYSSVYPYRKSKYGVDQHKLVSLSSLSKIKLRKKQSLSFVTKDQMVGDYKQCKFLHMDYL